jgi:alpha-tubulin suppressor-like RCC1 family protein
MKNRTLLLVTIALASGYACVLACASSSDDSIVSPAAGSGGAAHDAGGAAGTVASGGAAGTSGKGGTGGGGSGGTAGSAGVGGAAGGQAGQGGSQAGSGGQGGNAGGSAGAAGSAGASGCAGSITPPPATKLSGGNLHTCALTSAGGVKCWGWNRYGQLGNSSNTDSNVPVDVTGLTSGVKSVSAGWDHTCALTSGGSVKCWGYNEFGELGDGTKNESNVPLDVPAFASGGAVAIASGGAHTCVLTPAGAVKCWGANSRGQLGNGSGTDSKTPVDVIGLSCANPGLFSAGPNSCAVTEAGGLKCWGDNRYGELGNGSIAEASGTPVDVVGFASGVTIVGVAAQHICAVDSAGVTKCWGDDGHGQLGDNGLVADAGGESSNVPLVVSGLGTDVSALAGSNLINCALLSGGGVKCWGDNSFGQLGTGNTTGSLIPVSVNTLTSGVSEITCGFHHTCALMTAGGIKCWGAGSNGALGNGASADSHEPVSVTGL